MVASFGYINAFSEPIQEILYDLQMLESVKPVIKSFQNIVGRPVSVQAPQHSFDYDYFEKYFQTTGRIKIDNYFRYDSKRG